MKLIVTFMFVEEDNSQVMDTINLSRSAIMVNFYLHHYIRIIGVIKP